MSVLKKHNVNISGNGGEVLLFSHGFGCSQEMFRHMVPEFSDEYRIVLYDLAGSGSYDMACWNRENYQTLHGYARDLIAICEELQVTGVHFVGHSVSAMIGVLAGVRRPELFASLTLIGPSPRYINDGDYRGGFDRQDIDELLETMAGNYLGWSSTMAPLIMGNGERPALGEELTNNFCKTDPDAARHFANITFRSDNRADLPLVSQPTLVIQCTEDIIAPEYVGEYVHDQIPNSEYVLLNARGHCPNLSEPEKTSAALRDFLRKIAVPA